MRDFQVDLNLPEVEIVGSHRFMIQEGSSAVSFILKVNDRGSEVAEIKYRVCPIQTLDCFTEFMTLPDPNADTNTTFWQSSSRDHLFDGQLYRIHVSAIDVVARLAIAISSYPIVYDSSPPVSGALALIQSIGSKYASSVSSLKILINLAKDFDSDIASSHVCVGSYDQMGKIMDCTDFDDLIPCEIVPTSLYEYCFVVFANKVLPPNLTEVTAFYSATNVAGLHGIFSSDPIYFDFTPPEIEKGCFFYQ